MRRYDKGEIVGQTEALPPLADWVRSELEHVRTVLTRSDNDPSSQTTAYAQGRLAVLIEVQMRLGTGEES